MLYSFPVLEASLRIKQGTLHYVKLQPPYNWQSPFKSKPPWTPESHNRRLTKRTAKICYLQKILPFGTESGRSFRLCFLGGVDIAVLWRWPSSATF